MIQLTKYMGFAPSDNYAPERSFLDMTTGAFTATKPPHDYYLEPAEGKIFSELIRCPYEDAGEIVLSAVQRNKLLPKMIDYYSLHLGIRLQIKSFEVLRDLFSWTSSIFRVPS